MKASYGLVPSPLGELLLLVDGEGWLCGMYMTEQKHRPALAAELRRDDGAVADARAQLAAYFARELRSFDLPLRPSGSPFQREVWQALREIPFGTTVTYGTIARRIGQPTASRAVGLANGRNPIGIIVPCHRVVGANGSLVGYGGGLERKRWLLQHEGVLLT